VGQEASVPYLARLLNGRGFLGRREAAELRACAALGLGKVGLPEAQQALEEAVREEDPVVRSAVNRALRGGGE
jgi:HEAT repeat protein